MAQRTMTVCDVEDAADIAVAASARVQLHLDGEVTRPDLPGSSRPLPRTLR